MVVFAEDLSRPRLSLQSVGLERERCVGVSVHSLPSMPFIIPAAECPSSALEADRTTSVLSSLHPNATLNAVVCSEFQIIIGRKPSCSSCHRPGQLPLFSQASPIVGSAATTSRPLNKYIWCSRFYLSDLLTQKATSTRRFPARGPSRRAARSGPQAVVGRADSVHCTTSVLRNGGSLFSVNLTSQNLAHWASRLWVVQRPWSPTRERIQGYDAGQPREELGLHRRGT